MDKVLIITYYWPPSGGAGVQRWLKFSKYLPEYGWEPIILTVDPKKASYPQLDESLVEDVSSKLKVYRTSTFEIYSFYKKLSKNKEIPYGGFSNQSNPSLMQKLSRFIRGNFFIPDPRKGWNKYAVKKAGALIKKYKISTVVTTSPPHSTQLIGFNLKRSLNINWIADLRDPWTDIFYYHELKHSKIAASIDRKLELKVLKNADKIITISDGLKRTFQQKLSENKKIEVVHNGFDEKDFNTFIKKNRAGQFILTYTGTITEKYDISGLLEAIRNVQDKTANTCLLRFVGNVSENVKSKIREILGNENVKFVGYTPHKQSIAYLQSSDLLLLVIPNTIDNKGIVTGKIFEYLAVKKPIICIGPKDGDASKIIKECSSGETFSHNDILGISNYLLARMNKEAISYAFSSDRYSRKNLTKKLSDILDSQKIKIIG